MMKRLAAMQDWPLLRTRALTAVRTAARSRVGGGHDDEGIGAAELEHGRLMSQPAWAATARPAASEPVTVTAATRSSARTDSTCLDSMRRV